MSYASGTRTAESPRRAPPVGRALRIGFGLGLLALATPAYFQIGASRAIAALVVIIGLLIVYGLLQLAISRRVLQLGPLLGAATGLGLLVVVYLAGTTQTPVVGRGIGQLAAVTFLSISLVVTGVRADPGCEVLAVPGAVVRGRAELACLIFSPLDALERRWRNKGAT